MGITIYFNGKRIPEEKAAVPIQDRGLLYGHGVFETMRTYGGMLFRAETHLERFASAAKQLDIVQPHCAEDIILEIYSLMRENNIEDAHIRILLTKGAGGEGLWTEQNLRPTFAITAHPLKQYPRSWYQEGIKVSISKYRREIHSPLTAIKSSNYLLNALALGEAKAVGAQEAIFVNNNGMVAEGTISNVFAVTNGTLVTPSEEEGILPGITRQTVLDIAKRERVSLRVGPLLPEELILASEIFLTNSIMEIMPVKEINGRPVGKGKPGELTRKIAEWYKGLVEHEIKERSRKD